MRLHLPHVEALHTEVAQQRTNQHLRVVRRIVQAAAAPRHRVAEAQHIVAVVQEEVQHTVQHHHTRREVVAPHTEVALHTEDRESIV